MNIKTVQMIDVSDWDDIVIKTYGRPYSFQQQDGCKDRGVFNITVPSCADDYENDTVPEVVNHEDMGVSFAAWLARDPEQKLDSLDELSGAYCLRLWWLRNFYPDVQMIANDLHEKGFLTAGTYTINIDW